MVYAPPALVAKVAPSGSLARGVWAAASAICRRSDAARGANHHDAALRGAMRPADRTPADGGGGAVGRVLCLPNRALCRPATPKLLWGVARAAQSDGAGKPRAFARLDKGLETDAGASGASGLTGVLHAARCASPTRRRGDAALKPCMNELPAHAPVSIDRRLRPCRLYARSRRAGYQELH